jgi:hypothetical protein
LYDISVDVLNSPGLDAFDNIWYVYSELNADPNAADDWFLYDNTGGVRVVGLSKTATLQADVVTTESTEPGIAPLYTMRHYAEFLINRDLLDVGESSSDWIYGTNNAGELNPGGEVTVTITP